MDIDYNAIAALAALVAALAAVYAIWSESRRYRFAQGVDLILKIDERFNSKEMRETRRIAAKALLNKTNEDADDVLDFFEMVGLLTRCGALDKKMVWHTMFYWVHRYYRSAYEYIMTVRKKDDTLWSDLVYLHKNVVAIEKRERGCSDSDLLLSEDTLKKFLEDEIAI